MLVGYTSVPAPPPLTFMVKVEPSAGSVRHGKRFPQNSGHKNVTPEVGSHPSNMLCAANW